MNILILGSTGFVGKKLASYFNKNYKVITCARKPQNYISDIEIDIVFESLNSFDILDSIKNYKIDYIFYSLNSYYKNPNKREVIEMNEVNFIYPIEILKILNENNLKTKILFFSSYFDHISVSTESNEYAESKKKLTQYLNKETSINCFKSLEISDTFGTWDFRNKIFNLILKNVVKNKAIEIKNPEAIVNLVYINDLLRKIENFIFSDIKFDSFYSIYSINLINLQKLIVSLYNREITETNDYFQYEKRLEVTNSTYGLNTIRDIQDVIFDEEYLEFLKNE